MMTRRRFLYGMLGLGMAGLSGSAYAALIEPRWLRFSLVPVSLPRLKKPFRLLHMSDFHASPVVPLPFIEEAVELGLSAVPDVICLTGDFFTHAIPARADFARLLRRLAAAAPTVACLGNHDGGRWAAARGGYTDTVAVRDLLGDSGIRCLHNDSWTADLGGRTVEFVGVGDIWAGDARPETAFLGSAPLDVPRIVLSHNPDSKDLLQSRPWDLMLSGHTHGGQVVLPWIGAPFAPVMDHRFVHGLHPWDGRLIHVTSGVGNLHGLRFNCRPEVSLLIANGTA
jgi:uncharacterized protein